MTHKNDVSPESPTASPGTGDVGRTPGATARVWFVLRGIEVRLRFIAIFVAIGALFYYWDTLQNYWDRWQRPSAETLGIDADTEYYCPMHPSVVRASLEPDGSLPKCPICGMPLSKRVKSSAPPLPEGVLGRVQLSPVRIQQAGIRTVPIGYEPLVKEVRTVGFVEFDESRISKITSRVKGYVEKLHADRTFTVVAEDDPLAELYSPELYSTMQELQLARQRGSADLAASSRERLRLLGIEDRDIDALVSSSEPTRRLVLRTPHTGHVIEKNIVQGAYVDPGATLFVVADLSQVWIEAEVFEADLPLVREGQQVEATVEGLPGETFEGRVSLVHPHLESATRTNRVRIIVANPRHALRPGMFATVRIRVPMDEIEPFKSQAVKNEQLAAAATNDDKLAALQALCPVTGNRLGSMGKPVKSNVMGKDVYLCCIGCIEELKTHAPKYLDKLKAPPKHAVLAVPASAVIDTGTRKVVFVEQTPGVFDARNVELGPRADGYYPVVSGLMPGDLVAAAGAFLLDAETRLNPAAGSTYFGASSSTEHKH